MNLNVNGTINGIDINGLSNMIVDHYNDIDNPHNITKEQLGLGNLDDVKFGSINGIDIVSFFEEFIQFQNDKNNPHNITRDQLDIGEDNEITFRSLNVKEKINGINISEFWNDYKLKIDQSLTTSSNVKFGSIEADVINGVDLDKLSEIVYTHLDQELKKSSDVSFNNIHVNDKINGINLGNLESNCLLHINNKNNPHNITPDQLGLGIGNNVKFASLYLDGNLDMNGLVNGVNVRNLSDMVDNCINQELKTDSDVTFNNVTIIGNINGIDIAALNQEFKDNIDQSLNTMSDVKFNSIIVEETINGVDIADLKTDFYTRIDQDLNRDSDVEFNSVTARTINNVDILGLRNRVEKFMKRKDNPHGITPSQLGLGKQSDVIFNSVCIRETVNGINLNNFFTNYNEHVQSYNNPHNVTKEQIGLSNVTNQSKEDMFRDPKFTGIANFEHGIRVNGRMWLYPDNNGFEGQVLKTDGISGIHWDNVDKMTNNLSTIKLDKRDVKIERNGKVDMQFTDELSYDSVIKDMNVNRNVNSTFILEKNTDNIVKFRSNMNGKIDGMRIYHYNAGNPRNITLRVCIFDNDSNLIFEQLFNNVIGTMGKNDYVTLKFDNNVTLEESQHYSLKIVNPTNDRWGIGTSKGIPNKCSIITGFGGEYPCVVFNMREEGRESVVHINSICEVQKLIVKNYNIPTSMDSEGKKGEISYDGEKMYICVEDNKWKATYLLDF